MMMDDNTSAFLCQSQRCAPPKKNIRTGMVERVVEMAEGFAMIYPAVFARAEASADLSN